MHPRCRSDLYVNASRINAYYSADNKAIYTFCQLNHYLCLQCLLYAPVSPSICGPLPLEAVYPSLKVGFTAIHDHAKENGGREGSN